MCIRDRPERTRKHYSGTTHGNVLGPVLLPTSDHSWQMTVGNVYGAARPDPKDYPEEKNTGCQPPQRSDEQVEPVGYHSKPMTLYDELDHSYSIKAWIDLTALDESIALTVSYTHLTLPTKRIV